MRQLGQTASLTWLMYCDLHSNACNNTLVQRVIICNAFVQPSTALSTKRGAGPEGCAGAGSGDVVAHLCPRRLNVVRWRALDLVNQKLFGEIALTEVGKCRSGVILCNHVIM